jgi:dihydrofolate synthase/folylpolyglutamate synthase
MKLKTYEECINYLEEHLRQKRYLTFFKGENGFEKIKEFMKILDNPQDKLKIIHIAGTSGKGSIATILSYMFQNQDLKVGLHTSPFIYDIRERFVINYKLISKEKFVKYFNEILYAIEEIKKNGYTPSYFEISVALNYLILYKEKVDVAIIEVGVGGLYDGTNTCTRKDKICVLSKIGFDHTQILGNTIKKIAYQKAGIIQKENSVIALYQHKNVREEFEKSAKKNKTNISWIKKKEIESFKQNYNLPILGKHQLQNTSLALKAYQTFCKNNKIEEISKSQMQNNLNNIILPARIDIKTSKNKKIILDGAHNPQKLKALIDTLEDNFKGEKFTFIISFTSHKTKIKKLLELIIPYSSKIIYTTYNLVQDTPLHSFEIFLIFSNSNE